MSGGREAIIITEIPYQVNKSAMIEKMAELVREKRIEGISDIRDESDRHGIRVVIELKRDAVPDVVLNQLYRFTPLQSSSLSDVDGRLNATPMQVALAWLLRRSPNILLIPGTSSVAHLRENLAAADVDLPDDALAELDDIAASGRHIGADRKVAVTS